MKLQIGKALEIEIRGLHSIYARVSFIGEYFVGGGLRSFQSWDKVKRFYT